MDISLISDEKFCAQIEI